MSSPGSPTLILDARTRRAERAVATIALAAAGVAPWLADVHGLQALVYGLCCMGVAALGLYRAGWLGTARRLVGATWTADGRWTLSRHGQDPLDAVLLGDSRCGAGWVWLHWSTGRWSRRSMLLVRSDLSSGQLRRLVVRLRLQGAAGTVSAARPAF